MKLKQVTYLLFALVLIFKMRYQGSMAFDREAVKQQVERLSEQGLYIGTSSWKYEGWLGQLYTPSRYEYRGKVAKSRFERACLSEYAEVFKTVCVDAAYYNFPSEEYLVGLSEQVPSDFRFGFKVTDAITVKTFPNQRRLGEKAGKRNLDFLNAELFESAFLKPCEAIRQQVGVVMFEFSRFWLSDYQRGGDFVQSLDEFLSKLPPGWPYAIELRNESWLREDYFSCLSRHRVTHVFNSWQAMPSVGEQMALPGSRTNPNLVAARFLLKPGRKYEDAVKTFAPYDRVQEPYPEARESGTALIRETLSEKGSKGFVFVNNRLEGNALETIGAMLAGLHGI